MRSCTSTLKNPISFRCGSCQDIRDKVSAFKSFLAEKDIEYYGDVDEIGGLNVY